MRKIIFIALLLQLAAFAFDEYKSGRDNPQKALWNIAGSMNGKTPGFGLATAVTPEYVVTCAHFWADNDKQPVAVLIAYDLSSQKEADVIYMDHKVDLAVLRLRETLKSDEYISLADEPAKKDDVFAIPASVFGTDTAIQTSASLLGAENYRLFVKVANVVTHGHSGAPMLDKNNDVVGVVTHATIDGKIAVGVSADYVREILGQIENKRRFNKTLEQAYEGENASR